MGRGLIERQGITMGDEKKGICMFNMPEQVVAEKDYYVRAPTLIDLAVLPPIFL